MKIKFNRTLFEHRIKTLSSIFLVWIGLILPSSVMILCLNIIPNEISKNPLSLEKPMDYFFALIWLFSGLFPIILLKINWKKPYFYLLSVFSIYSTATFIPTIVPFFVRFDSKLNISLVKQVIFNTNLFFLITLVSMIFGYLLSLILIKEDLKRNFWWAFFFAIPYILTFFELKNRYNQFTSLLNLKEFSYKSLVQMLESLPKVNLVSINPLWFQLIINSIAFLILMEGGLLSVFIWKKTKKWREQEKKEKEVKV